MKKVKQLFILVAALSILTMPCNVFAANIPNEVSQSTRYIEEYHHNGHLIYDNVILNSSLGSNNVYLGQVNSGDIFEGYYYALQPDGSEWILVKMKSGQCRGLWGWIYLPYTAKGW